MRQDGPLGGDKTGFQKNHFLHKRPTNKLPNPTWFFPYSCAKITRSPIPYSSHIMSKHRLSAFAVGTADWMKYRPYEQFSNYDGFHLRLANRVFEELNHPDRFVRAMLPREQSVELAVVLTSWFEDYANEIGLWSAFVRKNKDLYRYWLPFFQLDGYSPDALNPEHIAYLAWHYCSKASRKFIAPDSPGLMHLGQVLAGMFDHALDDAPGTDFYEKYLTLADEVYFFDLKDKLQWMAFKNYLTGPEFMRNMIEDVENFFTKNPAVTASFSDPGKIIYMMQDDDLYIKNSSFLALTTPEWLTEVVRASDGVKEDILKLSQRVGGEFIYEDSDERHYRFQALYTRRLFEVRKESVSIKGIYPGELVLTTLVNWRGAWWVTGILTDSGDAESARKKAPKDLSPNSISFYAWSEEQQQILREGATDAEAAYLARTQLDPALKAKYKQQSHQIFQEMNWQRSVGAFFEPGAGMVISPVLAQIAYFLEQPEISPEQSAQLFFNLFNSCSPAMVHYLLEKHSSHNLRMPVKTHLSVEPYLEFLMRFYNPGALQETQPNNSLLSEF